jgi:hypothetical protein
MRSAISALVLILAIHGASAAVRSSISPHDFEALLQAHGAAVFHSSRADRVHVRVLEQDFDVRYLGCDELAGPDWVCAFSIEQLWPRVRLTPRQVNDINNRMALGRVYIQSSRGDGRKRDVVVVNYTVSLTGGVSDDYILKSFGEMVQGIADHFESALPGTLEKSRSHVSKR